MSGISHIVSLIGGQGEICDWRQNSSEFMEYHLESTNLTPQTKQSH